MKLRATKSRVARNLRVPPDLPTTLVDAILATAAKPGAASTPTLTRKQHCERLLRVLPLSICPSGFSSTLLSLARSLPWVAYAALTRLASPSSSSSNSESLSIQRIIHHLAPALRVRALVMPQFQLASLKQGSKFFPLFTSETQHPCTLAGALAVSLVVTGNWDGVELLIRQPWLDQSMWTEPILRHFLCHGDEEGFKWWDSKQLPIPAAVFAGSVLTAASSGHLKSLQWLVEKAHTVGFDWLSEVVSFDLFTAGVKSSNPRILDFIWDQMEQTDAGTFGFALPHWRLAGMDADGGLEMLEWARRHNVPFPEPYEFAFLDNIKSVAVLDWWRQHCLQHVDPDELEYSSDTMDFASKAGDLDRLNWWATSRLELRFSPAAIEWAKGTVEVEQWWQQCTQYQLLSGSISVDEAAAAGIAPCRHFATLCAWGRVDLLHAMDIDSQLEQADMGDRYSIHRGIVAACRFGQIPVLDHFPQLIERMWRNAFYFTSRECVILAIQKNQVGVLNWLYTHEYLGTITPDQWNSLLIQGISGFPNGYGKSACVDAVEWVCTNVTVPIPATEPLLSATLLAMDEFSILHQLWKHCGLGTCSPALTTGLIRRTVEANCQEMIDWWLQRKGELPKAGIDLLLGKSVF